MEAIILAGGLGTRLKEVVGQRPKALALINGRPFLDLLFKQLESFHMISKVVLALGVGAEAIIAHCKEKKDVDFSIENTPLGTGGALLYALNKVKTEPFLVINGDSYLDFSLEKLLMQHGNLQADMTLACVEVSNSSRFGALNFDSKTKRLYGFAEKERQKTQQGWINAGVYLMNRALLNSFPHRFPLSFEREVIPALLKKEVMVYSCSGLFVDIGTKESYFAAQHILKGVFHGN